MHSLFAQLTGSGSSHVLKFKPTAAAKFHSIHSKVYKRTTLEGTLIEASVIPTSAVGGPLSFVSSLLFCACVVYAYYTYVNEYRIGTHCRFAGFSLSVSIYYRQIVF